MFQASPSTISWVISAGPRDQACAAPQSQPATSRRPRYAGEEAGRRQSDRAPVGVQVRDLGHPERDQHEAWTATRDAATVRGGGAATGFGASGTRRILVRVTADSPLRTAGRTVTKQTVANP